MCVWHPKGTRFARTHVFVFFLRVPCSGWCNRKPRGTNANITCCGPLLPRSPKPPIPSPRRGVKNILRTWEDDPLAINRCRYPLLYMGLGRPFQYQALMMTQMGFGQTFQYASGERNIVELTRCLHKKTRRQMYTPCFWKVSVHVGATWCIEALKGITNNNKGNKR